MLEKYKLVLCLYIATQLKIFSVIRRCPTWWCFCLILNIIWIRNAFHDVVGVEFISIYMYMYKSINLRVFCLGARIMYELDPTPEVQKKSLEIATSLSESYTGITRLVIKHFLSYLKYFYKISPFLDKETWFYNWNSIGFPFEIAELYWGTGGDLSGRFWILCVSGSGLPDKVSQTVPFVSLLHHPGK